MIRVIFIYILLYKSEKENAKQQFWFLYEENENGGHFHAITNIKGFMGADYFCSKCLSCFHHKKAFDKHECNKHDDCKGCKTKQNKSATIGKEQAKHLRSKPLLGGSQELEDWIIKYTELHGCAPSDERIEAKQIEIKRGHYIVVDFETDTSTNTHMVNHANVDILITDNENKHDNLFN